MNPCSPQVVEIGPVLAVLFAQALTLAGTVFAAWNARRAAANSDAVTTSQGHLRASIENLGSIDPTLHKDTYK